MKRFIFVAAGVVLCMWSGGDVDGRGFGGFRFGRFFLDDRHAEIADFAQAETGEFLHFRRHRLEYVFDHVEAIGSGHDLDEVA